MFLTLEAAHLPRQGMKKRQYKKVKKAAARPSAGRSIEKRSPEIDDRAEIGHWEMDCVEGKKKTKETLLVLTERKAPEGNHGQNEGQDHRKRRRRPGPP